MISIRKSYAPGISKWCMAGSWLTFRILQPLGPVSPDLSGTTGDAFHTRASYRNWCQQQQFPQQCRQQQEFFQQCWHQQGRRRGSGSWRCRQGHFHANDSSARGPALTCHKWSAIGGGSPGSLFPTVAEPARQFMENVGVGVTTSTELHTHVLQHQEYTPGLVDSSEQALVQSGNQASVQSRNQGFLQPSLSWCQRP